MAVHFKSMISLLLMLFALSGCYNKPVRHLASDASLLKVGQSDRNDVLTYLGEPDEQITLGDGEEKWVFREYESSALKDAPVVGKYFGAPDYGVVTVILKNGIVSQCTYDAWEYGSDAWADDFSWQEHQE